ncbi:hypothetical protein TRFO_16730 [Tritrichomonas foetus]|uniref:Uncharacterized protein n=1 Tax=Tritrichomonas foetus TaxID=1144522 RepID=A0A1J4KPL4_9EUKA|nr:hypothetical protein TRFO_16730 [Tritrichomonas foetus]|eukprot:OHT13179.1 hypothetical protein TRFO_16730 [Tritrichomonas foetus]
MSYLGIPCCHDVVSSLIFHLDTILLISLLNRRRMMCYLSTENIIGHIYTENHYSRIFTFERISKILIEMATIINPTEINNITNLGSEIGKYFSELDEACNNCLSNAVANYETILSEQQSTTQEIAQTISENKEYIHVIKQMSEWAKINTLDFPENGSSSIIPMPLNFAQEKEKQKFNSSIHDIHYFPEIELTKPVFHTDTKISTWSDDVQDSLARIQNKFESFFKPEVENDDELGFQFKAEKNQEEKKEVTQQSKIVEEQKKENSPKTVFTCKINKNSAIDNYKNARQKRYVKPKRYIEESTKKEQLNRISLNNVYQNIENSDKIKEPPKIPKAQPATTNATNPAATTTPTLATTNPVSTSAPQSSTPAFSFNNTQNPASNPVTNQTNPVNQANPATSTNPAAGLTSGFSAFTNPAGGPKTNSSVFGSSNTTTTTTTGNSNQFAFGSTSVSGAGSTPFSNIGQNQGNSFFNSNLGSNSNTFASINKFTTGGK